MIRRLRTALAAGSATRSAGTALRRRPPGGADLWSRTNHRAEPVTLLEGPAYVIGALTGVASAPDLASRTRLAALVAGAAAAGLGAYDDLSGNSARRGLKGHLGALARGEVSTGAVKVLGLGVSGLLASALLLDREGEVAPRPADRAVDLLAGGALIAGTANLVNLLDLRPGRALKAVLILGGPLALSGRSGGRIAAAAAGAALAALPDDLAERSMLGDTGANPAGALLGVALAAQLSRPGRLLALTAVTGLTLASERVSFTAVIERTPGLRDVDAWGRRPPAPT